MAREAERAADRSRKANDEARAANREHMATSRATQDEDTREAERAGDRARKANEEARAANNKRMATEEARTATRDRVAIIRESQDEEAREAQRAADREHRADSRAAMDEEARAEARTADLTRKTNKRNKRSVQPRDGLRAKEVLAGTLIVPFIGDTEDSIGNMDVECPYCSALKFKNEPPSLCCNNGKIVSQPFPKPPPPFMKLFRPDLYPDGDADLTKVFLKYIRPLNNGLCLSSLKAEYKLFRRYNPTVIIQGQVHQYAGPLQAREGETPVFAQLYIQDPSLEITTRFANLTVPAGISAQEKSKLWTLLHRLQDALKDCNPYVRDFRQIISIPDEEMANGQLVISAKARPQGEHERRYNQQVLLPRILPP